MLSIKTYMLFALTRCYLSKSKNVAVKKNETFHAQYAFSVLSLLRKYFNKTKQACQSCRSFRTFPTFFFLSRHQLHPDKYNHGRNFSFDVMARPSSQKQRPGVVTSLVDPDPLTPI
jgi:hypothetical protein